MSSEFKNLGADFRRLMLGHPRRLRTRLPEIQPFYFIAGAKRGKNLKPSNADGKDPLAARLATEMSVKHWADIRPTRGAEPLTGQTCGREFEKLVTWFLKESFGSRLAFARIGKFEVKNGTELRNYQQYAHLEDLKSILDHIPEHEKELRNRLQATFSSYAVKPDVVVVRKPIPVSKVNRGWNPKGSKSRPLIDGSQGFRTPVIAKERNQKDLLHAIVSTKWTIRSDRAQNARTESAFAVHHRRGRAPHVVAVTGEPKPSRIRSLALGPDIDCVYHVCLPELEVAVRNSGRQVPKDPEQAEGLGGVKLTELDWFNVLRDMNRLRDITDLPFDLLQ